MFSFILGNDHSYEDIQRRNIMNCILFGGSGEVGGAVVRELLKSDVCSKLTLPSVALESEAEPPG